jgi:hypothetical protein
MAFDSNSGAQETTMRLVLAPKMIYITMLLAGLFSANTARADNMVYICAINEARVCTPDEPCKSVALQDLYIAPLMIFDLNKKSLVSASMDDRGREESIDGFKRTKTSLTVYGHAEDETWSAIFSLASGKMTGSINTGETAHVLFGHCAPHTYPN